MDIKELLSKFNDFEECIIEDIKFSKQLTEIEITFNYIWDECFMTRKDLDKKRLVCLKIESVRQFKLQNELSEIEGFSDNLNWGYNEVATIIVSQEKPFNEMTILWESERKITVLFSGSISIMELISTTE